MKRTIAMLLCGAMMLSMVACGKSQTVEKKTKEDKTETAEAANELGEAKVEDFEYKALDYVTLGDYKNLEVTITGDYEPSEEGLRDYVNNTMIAGAENAYFEDESQTEVKEDSVVNVDYTGYKDGEAFAGGAATDVLLDIANNGTPGGGNYIDGFSSGLVGAKVGETVDCDVTFPENYGNADLAGAAVVFRFKVNYICAPANYDGLTDEYVSKVFGYDTVDAFLGSAKEAYEADLEDQHNYDIRSAVIKQVIDNATVNSYPETVVAARTDDYIRLLMKQFGVNTTAELNAAWAADSSMSGATVEEYRSYVEERVKTNLNTEMVFLAIAETEGLELSDEAYQEYIKEYLSADGASEETLALNYGSTVEVGSLYIHKLALANLGVKTCTDTATITEEKPAEE
ncbi:MAG: FKBP-type peptidyl-prolyl cis-trans isomerase [Lachnospiraceae bacterium]|nr:FKBP-type peptidyl-prolyl cis-trans isomerase [Lachnospiraceae bacterium]